MLRFLKKRGATKFLNSLQDAVDVIVRGVKTGLPCSNRSRSSPPRFGNR